jgi:LmbE family N-acetylglucosaminyl deacetylase
MGSSPGCRAPKHRERIRLPAQLPAVASVSRVLFVFAHQDDEYMAVPWLLEERAAGAEIVCIYLTDGGGHGVDPPVRDAESRAALRSIGIGNDAVVMLAAPNGRIGDGQLALRSLEALTAVETWIDRSGFAPQRLYAPSYEGGHPDHDAAHLLAAVVAGERGIAGDAWHFSLYNAYRRPRPFFATMRQLPTSSPSRRAAMSPGARWRATWLCSHYRSQRRTWLGLFPGAAYARLIARGERAVRFDLARLASRPHEGELLYERMFATSFAQFETQTRVLRERLNVTEKPAGS